MEYLVVAFIAFIVGFKVAQELHARLFSKMLEELGITEKDLDKLLAKMGNKDEPQATQEEINEELLEEIEVKIESHQGQLYAFRVEDDKFLGQGTDRESLVKRLAESMTGVRLIIREENGAQLIKEAH